MYRCSGTIALIKNRTIHQHLSQICPTLVLPRGPWGNISIAIWRGCEPPDSKVHGANMGPIWGRQDPGGPHVGPMNFYQLGQSLLCFCFLNLCLHWRSRNIVVSLLLFRPLLRYCNIATDSHNVGNRVQLWFSFKQWVQQRQTELKIVSHRGDA